MMMSVLLDGSVDDAHTILGVEEDYFTRDFKEYLLKERLYGSRFGWDPTFGWVFWSQLDNSADKIRQAIQKLMEVFGKELEGKLVQFWAATKTSEGRTLLTTQFQPFALGKTYFTSSRNPLCEYRMGMCREYNNSFYADAECAQEQLGLPGRVFLNQLPESIPHVKHYTLKEYPQRDLALRCEIGSSLGLPVFEHSSRTCVGVLEIVSLEFKAPFWHDKSILGQMYDIFQVFGLICFDGRKHYKMPIHGRVHDADTILGVEELNHFPPNFQEYIQKEQLKCSRIEGDEDVFGRPTFRWVFWSQQDHQIQLDKFADLIRHALQKLIFKEQLLGHIVQFWAPTKMSQGRTLLTTQFQPFALGTTYTTDARNLICEYRMGMCREYSSFYADAVSGEEQLGLPGRVFVNKLPESTLDVEHYTLKEYPQRDLALRCKIGSSWAEPVFDHSSHSCVGVLEIVSLAFMSHVLLHKSIHGQMYDIFQEFGLLCFDGYKHYEMQIGDANNACTTAFQELKTVLETVCKIHELPLAMTWVPCTACDDLLRGQLLSEGVEFCGHGNFNVPMFVEVSKCSHLRKGGVVGMVLSSPNMLYCSDITQLTVVEYPLVPYARQCEFGGWFTICLQSSYTANDNYVLEFFLPRINRYGYDSRTTLSLILGTMEENFKTFKLASGQELRDLLSVQVLDFQKGRILHSVQKIQAKGGGVMLQLRQLDQASPGAIHSGTNVISEDQNYILPSLEALQNGEVTMKLDSSHQPPLDATNNGPNAVITEQNIIAVTSSEGGPREMQDRQHKNTGVRLGISLDDIRQCFGSSRTDAAASLGVSVSTFKRLCRAHGISPWPGPNTKKFGVFRPPPVENEGQTRQRLNSDLPSNQASDSVAHTKPAFQDADIVTIMATKPAFQDADIVTIKAKYENITIKFRLSLPSSLVALQQEVKNRLNLEAGTYHVEYKDEDDDWILITCDQDLQEFTVGNTSVVVQLVPK